MSNLLPELYTYSINSDQNKRNITNFDYNNNIQNQFETNMSKIFKKKSQSLVKYNIYIKALIS